MRRRCAEVEVFRPRLELIFSASQPRSAAFPLSLLCHFRLSSRLRELNSCTGDNKRDKLVDASRSTGTIETVADYDFRGKYDCPTAGARLRKHQLAMSGVIGSGQATEFVFLSGCPGAKMKGKLPDGFA